MVSKLRNFETFKFLDENALELATSLYEYIVPRFNPTEKYFKSHYNIKQELIGISSALGNEIFQIFIDSGVTEEGNEKGKSVEVIIYADPHIGIGLSALNKIIDLYNPQLERILKKILKAKLPYNPEYPDVDY